MDGVYDGKDMIGIEKMSSLINTISYCKEFSFSRCNINRVINCLDDQSVMTINMSYRYGHLILDACIYNNNNQIMIR